MSWSKSIAAVALIATTVPALADSVRLNNGDLISGEVVSVDAKQVKLTSEVLGELTIPRHNVSGIFFGDAPPTAIVTPSAAPSSSAVADGTDPGAVLGAAQSEDVLNRVRSGQQVSPGEILQQLGGTNGQPGQSPEDLVQQLQSSGGINPAAVEQMQKSFPLLAAPEAQEYFQNTLGGLMGGSINVQDVRKDAVRALNLIDELETELGSGAQALQPYRSILQKFVREAAPTAEQPRVIDNSAGESAGESPDAETEPMDTEGAGENSTEKQP